MQIFLWGHFTFMALYITLVKTFHELKKRYLLYPKSGKYGKKRIKFFNTQKLEDRKSNRHRVSVWTDSSAFLSCHVRGASLQTNVPPFMGFLLYGKRTVVFFSFLSLSRLDHTPHGRVRFARFTSKTLTPRFTRFLY